MLDWQQSLNFKLQPEMYAVEGFKTDGTDSWRATEKPVIEGESSIAAAVQVPPFYIKRELIFCEIFERGSYLA